MITAKKEKDYLKNAFAAGAHDYIEKPINKIEFLARVKAALRLREEMKKRKEREEELLKTSKKLKKANKKLEKMASMDGLTGLANRRLFDKTLKKEMLRAKRNKSPISLIMADIDNFKDYNDNYGHQAGDQVLRELSELLKSEIREDDIVARYGGEEFVIYFNVVDQNILSRIISRLMEKIRKLRVNFAGDKLEITVSIGVAVNQEGKYAAERLIKQADTALYIAKGAGRDMVKFYRNLE